MKSQKPIHGNPDILGDKDIQQILYRASVKIYCDGTLFQGNMDNGLKHGFGRIDFSKCCYYIGTIKNGLRDGYGEFYYMSDESKKPKDHQLDNSFSDSEEEKP